MRASFARGWPFVVAGRGICAVRCVHRYTQILRTRVMGLGRAVDSERQVCITWRPPGRQATAGKSWTAPPISRQSPRSSATSCWAYMLLMIIVCLVHKFSDGPSRFCRQPRFPEPGLRTVPGWGCRVVRHSICSRRCPQQVQPPVELPSYRLSLFVTHNTVQPYRAV